MDNRASVRGFAIPGRARQSSTRPAPTPEVLVCVEPVDSHGCPLWTRRRKPEKSTIETRGAPNRSQRGDSFVPDQACEGLLGLAVHEDLEKAEG